jgi:thiamine biosynthesis lipoprotein
MTQPPRQTLTGPTMGTTWTVTFHGEPDPARLKIALQTAVAEVDQIASTWNPSSDLMRLNAAPVNTWVPLPPHLMTILTTALHIGQMTDGAFDIGLGDAVNAWGFGPDKADEHRIRQARVAPRQPAHHVLQLDGDRALKRGPMQFDLSGIAKGYGVDRLAETLLDHGITQALVSLDGELRALGTRQGGSGWTIAVEQPLHSARAPHSVLALQDVALATSGDYRHWVQVGRRVLSHTIDPATGAPLTAAPASVSVLAPTCMIADAMATALMVMGVDKGANFAAAQGIDALFLLRDGAEIRSFGVGPVFKTKG